MINIVMMILLLMIECYDLFIIDEGCLLVDRKLFIGLEGSNDVRLVILSTGSLCGRCIGSARKLTFSFVTLG